MMDIEKALCRHCDLTIQRIPSIGPTAWHHQAYGRGPLFMCPSRIDLQGRNDPDTLAHEPVFYDVPPSTAPDDVRSWLET